MGYGAAVVQRDQLQNHQFRRVNKDRAYTHQLALEFPDGKIVLVTTLN